MISVSDRFKTKCKEQVATNRLGYLKQGETEIRDDLVKFSISDTCFVNGKILGTTVVKEISSAELLDEHDLIDKNLNAFVGLKYDDLTEEYINLGKYTVVKPEASQVASKTQFKAQNDMTKFKVKYIDNNTYPTTLGVVFENLCSQVGLVPFSTTFLNSDFVVDGNPYTNNENCDVVLSDIGEMACSFAEIGANDNKVYLKELSTTVNETIDRSLYDELKINKVYGPVNSLIIRLSNIEGENVTRQDDASILANGLCELTIADNEFLHDQATREAIIDSIWNKVNGLTYVDCELTNCCLPYLEKGDKIIIKDKNDNDVSAYVLNYSFTFSGSLTGNIKSPSLTKTETILKNTNSLPAKFRKVEYEINKLDGRITQTIEQVSETNSKIVTMQADVDSINEHIEDNRYYTDEQGNQQLISQKVLDISKTVDGIDSKITQLGGQNLWINPVGLFGSYGWIGICKEYTDTEIKNNTFGKSALFLQNGTRSQTAQTPNGQYTLSFLYKKLISLASCKILINGTELLLDNLDWTSGQLTFEVKSNTVEIQLISDTNDSCYVSDLMLNAGIVAQKYSSNATEVVTNNVKIGDGIEISSNASETLWKSNNDGTRIYDTNDLVNPVTEFTRQGTKTNELTTEKAKIGSMLVQEHTVDGEPQMWFSM
jgi:hypothetical protein